MEEGMTDYQFKIMLKMLYMLIDSCKDIEEAKSKIDELIEILN